MNSQPENRVNVAWKKIVDDVWTDDTGRLRERLRKDPRSVFQSYGVNLPQDIDVSVLENTIDALKFVIPVKPGSVVQISDKDIVEVYQACPGTQLDFAGGR